MITISSTDAARASADSETRLHQAKEEGKPTNVVSGVFQGMKSLGEGVVLGVAGVVTEPIKVCT